MVAHSACFKSNWQMHGPRRHIFPSCTKLHRIRVARSLCDADQIKSSVNLQFCPSQDEVVAFMHDTSTLF
jgi:hypothetical protein